MNLSQLRSLTAIADRGSFTAAGDAVGLSHSAISLQVKALDAGRGGIVSAGICQIGIHKDYIRLDFIHGAFLPDPHNLLTGTQKVKRFVQIKKYEDAHWEYLKELIAVSAKLDPRSLATKNVKR